MAPRRGSEGGRRAAARSRLPGADRADHPALRHAPRGASPSTTAPGRWSRSTSHGPIPCERPCRPSPWRSPTSRPSRGSIALGGRETYYYAVPLVDDQRARGVLVILQDATHIDKELRDLVRLHALRFAVLVVLLSLVTLLVVRRSVTHPLRRLAEWTHQLRAGSRVPPPPMPDTELFGPLATEVSDLGRTLAKARMAIAEEARLRLRGEAMWTEERLAQFARARLGDRPLVVVSNREPVSHVWRNRRIVTADARERRRDGDGARDAGLRRRLDRARQRRRRPRGRRRARDDPAPAGQPRDTRSSASGSPRRRRPATTTASPTRGSGRSATSSMRAPPSGPRTGGNTRPSTRSSPTRSSR